METLKIINKYFIVENRYVPKWKRLMVQQPAAALESVGNRETFFIRNYVVAALKLQTSIWNSFCYETSKVCSFATIQEELLTWNANETQKSLSSERSLRLSICNNIQQTKSITSVRIATRNKYKRPHCALLHSSLVIINWQFHSASRPSNIN